MNPSDIANEICLLQNRLGRLESTLFVHTPLTDIHTPLFTYLKYLRFVDNGKTFQFSPGSRIAYPLFRKRAIEWLLSHYETVLNIDWVEEHQYLKYFNLHVDGDYLVGLE